MNAHQANTRTGLRRITKTGNSDSYLIVYGSGGSNEWSWNYPFLFISKASKMAFWSSACVFAFYQTQDKLFVFVFQSVKMHH